MLILLLLVGAVLIGMRREVAFRSRTSGGKGGGKQGGKGGGQDVDRRSTAALVRSPVVLRLLHLLLPSSRMEMAWLSLFRMQSYVQESILSWHRPWN